MKKRQKIDHAEFQADMQTLDQMLQWVRKFLIQGEFPEIHIRKIELAVEEAIVNVIHYAYHDRKGPIELICSLYPQDRMELIIKDQGPAFNPLMQKQKINPEASLEEREEGGLGILLMREYMDDVHYKRNDPYNVLTFVKKE